jgi:proline dehydrogenase
MGVMRNILLWASQSQQLREALPRYRFFRNAVSRFMPGEEIEDALRAAGKLQKNRIATIITYLGENVKSDAEAIEVARHYCEVLDSIDAHGLDCHVSPKLTQLGLDLSKDLSYSNLISIIEHAQKLGNYVWIDMESTQYTDVTLELYRSARKEHHNVGLCIQSYLYRTADDLKSLLDLSPGIRLVKGAYAEPPDVAFREKKDVDDNFLLLSRQLLSGTRQNGVLPAFATHDPKLILCVKREAETMGLSKEEYEFQLLYGIQREQQMVLANEGYRIRVLISYGSYWFPWYIRRLAERPANLLFVLRNFFVR